MEVREFQTKIVDFVDAWDKKRKVRATEQLVFCHIVEEVGELAREYVNKESRKDRFSKTELDNAIGDALMQLVQLAHLRGLDIETLVAGIIAEEQEALQAK